MSVPRQVKQNARRALRYNWGKAVAIVLLVAALFLFFSVLYGILNLLTGIGAYFDIYRTQMNFFDDIHNLSLLSLAISLILSLGFFFVMAPLRLGIDLWCYEVSGGQETEVSAVFRCFSGGKMFFRSLGLQISLFFRLLFWLLLLCLPSAVCLAGAGYLLGAGAQGGPLAPLAVTLCCLSSFFLAAGGMVLFCLVRNRYFLAPYYLLDGNTSVCRAVKLSRKSMKGFKGKIFRFQLSFVGWWLSCLLVIPIVYVFPYYEMSRVLYGRYIMEYARRSASPEGRASSPCIDEPTCEMDGAAGIGYRGFRDAREEASPRQPGQARPDQAAPAGGEREAVREEASTPPAQEAADKPFSEAPSEDAPRRED